MTMPHKDENAATLAVEVRREESRWRDLSWNIALKK